MSTRRQVAIAALASVVLFLLVQLGALALVHPFQEAGYQAVEDPQDPTNSLFYVGVLLVATAAMLLALRLGYDRVLRGFIVLTAGLISLYVFRVVLPPVHVGGVAVLPWLAAAALAGALLLHPEWYVIDGAGVVMGAGAAALFGITFGVLPAIVLLVVLAVYDAISVYGTEHMLALASGVMEMRVPVILVVPLSLDYSFLAAVEREVSSDGVSETSADDVREAGDETAADGNPADADRPEGVAAGGDPDDDAVEADEAADPFERDAFYIGLGDAVMPAILAASAAFFLDAGGLDVLPGVALSVPALGAMVGTLLGLLALIGLVMQGRAHAGLPLLNGGAILGYVVGAMAVGVPVVEALGLAPYL